MQDASELAGKVALVTGGARNIGRASEGFRSTIEHCLARATATLI